MSVREHADLLEPLMRSPDDEGKAISHRRLHGKYRLPRQAMPVDASKLTQRRARETLDRHRVDVLHEQIAVEPNPQVRQVPDSKRGIEVLVIRDEERSEAEALLDEVDDEV